MFLLILHIFLNFTMFCWYVLFIRRKTYFCFIPSSSPWPFLTTQALASFVESVVAWMHYHDGLVYQSPAFYENTLSAWFFSRFEIVRRHFIYSFNVFIKYLLRLLSASNTLLFNVTFAFGEWIPSDFSDGDAVFLVIVFVGLYITWLTTVDLLFERPPKDARDVFDYVTDTMDYFLYKPITFLLKIIKPEKFYRVYFKSLKCFFNNNWPLFDIKSLPVADSKTSLEELRNPLMLYLLTAFLLRFSSLFSIVAFSFWSYRCWITPYFVSFGGSLEDDFTSITLTGCSLLTVWWVLAYMVYPYIFTHALNLSESKLLLDPKNMVDNLALLWRFNTCKIIFFFCFVILGLIIPDYVTCGALNTLLVDYDSNDVIFYNYTLSWILSIVFHPAVYFILFKSLEFFLSFLQKPNIPLGSYYIYCSNIFDVIVSIFISSDNERDLASTYRSALIFISVTRPLSSPAALGLSSPSHTSFFERDDNFSADSKEFIINAFLISGLEAFFIFISLIVLHLDSDLFLVYSLFIVVLLMLSSIAPFLMVFRSFWNPSPIKLSVEEIGTEEYKHLVYLQRWAGRSTVLLFLISLWLIVSVFTGSIIHSFFWIIELFSSFSLWLALIIVISLGLICFFSANSFAHSRGPIAEAMLSLYLCLEEGCAPTEIYKLGHSPCLLVNKDIFFDFIEVRFFDSKIKTEVREGVNFKAVSAALIIYVSSLIVFNYWIDGLFVSVDRKWGWILFAYIFLASLYIYIIAMCADIELVGSKGKFFIDAVVNRPRFFFGHPLTCLFLISMLINRFELKSEPLAFRAINDYIGSFAGFETPVFVINVVSLFLSFAFSIILIFVYFSFVLLVEILFSATTCFFKYYGEENIEVCVKRASCEFFANLYDHLASSFRRRDLLISEHSYPSTLLWLFGGRVFFTLVARETFSLFSCSSFMLIFMPCFFGLNLTWTGDTFKYSTVFAVATIVLLWRLSSHIFESVFALCGVRTAHGAYPSREFFFAVLFCLAPVISVFLGFSLAFYRELLLSNSKSFSEFYSELFDFKYYSIAILLSLFSFASILLSLKVMAAIIHRNSYNSAGLFTRLTPLTDLFALHLLELKSRDDCSNLLRYYWKFDHAFNLSYLSSAFSLHNCANFPFQAHEGAILYKPFSFSRLFFKCATTLYFLIDSCVASYFVVCIFEASAFSYIIFFPVLVCKFIVMLYSSYCIGGLSFRGFYSSFTNYINLSPIDGLADRHSAAPIRLKDSSMYWFHSPHLLLSVSFILFSKLIIDFTLAWFVVDSCIGSGAFIVRNYFINHPSLFIFICIFICICLVIMISFSLAWYIRSFHGSFYAQLESALPFGSVSVEISASFVISVFVLFFALVFNYGLIFENDKFGAFCASDLVIFIFLLFLLNLFLKPIKSSTGPQRIFTARFVAAVFVILFTLYAFLLIATYFSLFSSSYYIKAATESLLITNVNTISSFPLILCFKLAIILFSLPWIISCQKYLADGRVTYSFFSTIIMLIWLNIFLIGIDNLLIALVIFDAISLLTISLISNRRTHRMIAVDAAITYFVSSVATSIFAYLGLFVLGCSFSDFRLSSVTTLLRFGTSNDLLIITNPQAILLIFALLFFKSAFLAGLFPFNRLIAEVCYVLNYPALMYVLVISKVAPLFFIASLLKLVPFSDDKLFYFFSAFGLASVLLGSLRVAKSVRLKELFAYSSISQMGYILCVISSFSYSSYYVAYMSFLSYGFATCLLLYFLSCAYPLGVGSSSNELSDIIDVAIALRRASIKLDFYGIQIPEIDHAQAFKVFAYISAMLSLAGFAPALGFFVKLCISQCVITSGYYIFVLLLFLAALVGAVGYFNFVARNYSSLVGGFLNYNARFSRQEFLFHVEAYDAFVAIYLLSLMILSLVAIFHPDLVFIGSDFISGFYNESVNKTNLVISSK